MKLPLFAKIWICFLVNLVLVVGVLFGFIAFQARVDLHTMLNQNAVDRFYIAARLISHDLSQVPPSAWAGILARHQEIYQVDFALVLSSDAVVASREAAIPAQVMDRIHEIRLKWPQSFFSKESGPPLDGKDFKKLTKNGEKHDWGEGHGGERRLMMHTGSPTRYWIGTRILVPGEGDRLPEAAMLLAVSDSVTGKGFFFDPVPWIAAGGGILLLSLALWVPLVRHITRPLRRMTRAAEEIEKGNFDAPILERRRDEIGRLSGAIHHMTGRLRGFVEGQKRFLRDVAHELGTPIARIRFGLGILEQHVGKENQARLEDVAEEVAHMAGLVNELLSFSRADMSPEKVQLTSVELLPVIQKVSRREGIGAEDLVIDIAPALAVTADPLLLARAFANVVRNAVKYGGAAGPIRISAKRENDTVVLEVADSGAGVPKEFLERIFEPFFRPDTSRTRESGGTGLGLSIVRTCVAACGGTVSARNLKPAGFSITLTLSAAL